MDTYIGPPDMIYHDAGLQFTANEFKTRAQAMNISLKMAGIEAHHSIGLIERYHAPLRRAYQVIKEDLPAIGRHEALQMAVKSVNDTAGPNGLTPTLLVFGTFPRMDERDPPHPSINERSKAIQRAMEGIRKLHASRQVSEALQLRNGPQIDEILDTPIGSQVWVHRENRGWKGPYKLLHTAHHRCSVEINGKPRIFNITSVKPYLADQQSINTPANEAPAPPQANEQAAIPPARQAIDEAAESSNSSNESDLPGESDLPPPRPQ